MAKFGGRAFTFKINGESYLKSLFDVRHVFKFPKGFPVKPNFDNDELHEVWQILTGEERLVCSRAKGNRIRSPVFNNARRAIAEVFYAKDKAGPVVLNELKFLCTALKKLKGRFLDSSPIMGETRGSSLSYRWMAALVEHSDRMIRTYDPRHPRSLPIGGPISALLKYCDVPLNEADKLEPYYIDIKHLRLAQYLDTKECNGEPVYRFSHITNGDSYIVLPNTDLTSISEYDNIVFNPPVNLLTPPASLSARPRKRTDKKGTRAAPRRVVEVPSPPPTETAEEETPFSYDAIEAYNEEPGTYAEYYAPATASATIRASHNRTNLLSKPVKWAVKHFKGFVKHLKAEKTQDEKRWAEEKKALERKWKKERDEIKKDLDEQRALWTSISARFEENTSSGILPGRHSMYAAPTHEGSPMETSPINNRTRRRSIAVEPARTTRDNPPAPTLPSEPSSETLLQQSRWWTPDATTAEESYDTPMDEARPRRRRTRKKLQAPRHNPAPYHTDEAGPSTTTHEDGPMLNFSNDYIEAQRLHYFNYQ